MALVAIDGGTTGHYGSFRGKGVSRFMGVSVTPAATLSSNYGNCPLVVSNCGLLIYEAGYFTQPYY